MQDTHVYFLRYKEAEVMYTRALTGYKKMPRPDHTLMLETVNNMSNLYENQSRLAEAEAMYDQAVTGKKALSPDHPFPIYFDTRVGG